MIEYLKEYYPGKTVYLVGTPDLEENFRENGILLTKAMPDVVVIGFDLTLTYEKLERACTYIRNGSVFLATHLDINCPTRDGFIPDCGAMCAAISLSTANGAHGILVLSGETKPGDLENAETVPDAVFTGLKEMAEIMAEMPGK